MTVKELIEKLQAFQPDIGVEIKIVCPEDRKEGEEVEKEVEEVRASRYGSYIYLE